MNILFQSILLKLLNKRIALLALVFFWASMVFAQLPREVDQLDDFSIRTLSDVILFIVLPVIAIVGFILWKRRMRKIRKEMEEKQKDKDRPSN